MSIADVAIWLLTIIIAAVGGWYIAGGSGGNRQRQQAGQPHNRSKGLDTNTSSTNRTNDVLGTTNNDDGSDRHVTISSSATIINSGGGAVDNSNSNSGRDRSGSILVDNRPLPNTTFVSSPKSTRSRSNSDSEPSSGRPRLIIVAKTLPVKCTRSENGSWHVEWDDTRSFLSNLRVLKKTIDVKWVGATGVHVPVEEQADLEQLLEDYDCVPVFLQPELQDRFFNGFCKGILWPLLHYVMPQSKHEFGKTWDSLWQSYQSANMLFAKTIARAAESPDATVWIQNYHLLLVPSFLRTKLPRAKIGLFIHTPFPSSDILRLLPAREPLLRGIMCADLLGFHTFDYARHFLSCCKRVLDLDFETMTGGSLGVKYSGRYVSIRISHVGIESEVFSHAARSPEVATRVAEIRKKYAPRRIIIGVDDLDIVKGSALKLQAFDRFLTTHHDWKDKVVLIQVILPTATVKAERKLVHDHFMMEIDAIRLTHGNDVIEVIERGEIPFTDMVAYYNAAQVAVVSTFWDGLNLAPYEFTASQDPQDPGALVLSEFMGCSRSLSGCIRVNPWAIEGVAEAMNQALSLSLEERRANHQRRHHYVMSQTVERWAHGFLEHLDKASKLAADLVFAPVGWGSNVRLVGLRADFRHLDEGLIANSYRYTSTRIILLDYDGTLTAAEKDEIKTRLKGPSSKIKKYLRTLCEDPNNFVFIIAGRQRNELSNWFGDIKELGLAAEKGCFIRWPASRAAVFRTTPVAARPSKVVATPLSTSTTSSRSGVSSTVSISSLGTVIESKNELPSHDTSDNERISNDDWESMVPDLEETYNWKDIALDVIRGYTEHTDGSWIEDKEYAIVWHYAQADPEYGRMQASELQKYLARILPNDQVDVVKYDYNHILEVKPHGINKGHTAAFILRTVLRYTTSIQSTPRNGPGTPQLVLPINRSARAQGSPTAQSPASPASPHANPLVSPFLLCVGDDRSDEDMFRALHHYDDIKEQMAEKSPTSHRSTSSISSGRHSRRPSNDGDTRRGRRTSNNNEPDTPIGSTPSNLMNNLDDESKIGKFDANTYTCCVGIKPSCARFYLRDHDDVAKLLAELATCSDRMNYSKSRHLLASPVAMTPAGAAYAHTSSGLTIVTGTPRSTSLPFPLPADHTTDDVDADAMARRDDKRPAPVELPADQFEIDEPRAWPTTESAFVRQFAAKGAAAYDREIEPQRQQHQQQYPSYLNHTQPLPSPQSARTNGNELGDDLPSATLSLSPSSSLSSYTPAPSSPKGIQTITAEGLKSSLGALSGSRTSLSSMAAAGGVSSNYGISLPSRSAPFGGAASAAAGATGGLGGFGMSTSRSTGGLADLVRKRHTRHATNDDDFSDDDDEDDY